MWWLRQSTRITSPIVPTLGRLGAVLCLSALLAGCFQPLYGNQSIGDKPGMRQALSSVRVKQIDAPNGTPEARLAVEVRNQLLFDLTGGGDESSPTHELDIKMTTNRSSVIIDLTSQRPDVENFGTDIVYTLKDLATGKVVVRAMTFARVSYDTPGSEQRYARIRGLRDAEDRAAKVVADQIRNRLASYFYAGT
jgi:LPS-assembly lipoprotein